MPTINIEEQLSKMGLLEQFEEIKKKPLEEKQAILERAGITAPLGSREATKQLLEQKDNRIKELTEAIEPKETTITDILTQREETLPVVETTPKTDEMAAKIPTLAEELARVRKTKTEREKALGRAEERKEEKLAEIKPEEEIQKETLIEFGITPERRERLFSLVDQIGAINKKIAEMQAQRDTAVMTELQREGVSIGVARGRASRLEQDWNRRINTQIAIVNALSVEQQALRRAFSTALALVDRVAEAKTADQEFELEQINTFIEENKDIIDELTEEEKELINTIREKKELEIQADKNEIKTVGTMLLTAAERFGVDLPPNWQDMKVEEAIDYLAPRIIQAQQTERKEDFSGFFSPEQLRRIRRAGIDLSTPEGLEKAISMFPSEAPEEIIERRQVEIINELEELSDQTPLRLVKKKIEEAGFDPEDKTFQPFLKRFKKTGLLEKIGRKILPQPFETFFFGE